MAHNARIRPASNWTLNSTVDPAEFEALDQAQFEAINGDQGGTWAPAAPIIIGGSGLQVTAGCSLAGNTTLESTSALQVEGTANFDNSTTDFIGVSVNLSPGTLTIGATTFQVSGPVGQFLNGILVTGASSFLDDVGIGSSIADTLTVNAVSQFNGNVVMNGTLAVVGDLTLDGSASCGDSSADLWSFAAKVTLNAEATLSGAGQLIVRATVGADADGSYGVNSYDVVHVNSLTANRVYTVTSTNAVTGSRIRFRTFSTTNSVQLKRADASNIASLKLNGTGEYNWVDLLWIGGRWELSAYDLNP